MYQINEKVWSVIYPFDTPKETIIINVNKTFSNIVGVAKSYNVLYKNREFEVQNHDIYPTKIEAEIYWSILTIQDYEQSLTLPDLIATDDYEIAYIKAQQLIFKYTETHPHLILKNL